MIEYVVTDFHSPDAKCRGALADLMLDADIIPPCGLIPPLRVLMAVIQSGGSRNGMSRGCIWEPFDLSEEAYWQAVEQLEQFTPDDLRSRHRQPHIIGEIHPDYEAPNTDDYGAWLQSLVERGYLPGKPVRNVK